MHHEQLQFLTELEVDFYTSKNFENRGAIFFYQNSSYIS